MARLLAPVLPLALDTFAVSAALAVAGVSGRRRLSLSLVFALFEGGMPLVGLAVGALVGAAIGGLADYVAIVLLAALGVYMFRAEESGQEARIATLARSTGLTFIAVGLAVSIDELAIGFAVGVARVPVVPAILLISLQAFAVSQLGFGVGLRIGEAVREGAERIAGGILILLAALLLLAKFAPVPF